MQRALPSDGMSQIRFEILSLFTILPFCCLVIYHIMTMNEALPHRLPLLISSIIAPVLCIHWTGPKLVIFNVYVLMAFTLWMTTQN